MKAKRVECSYCKNFIDVVQKDPENLISDILHNASCKLGKRVMFRMPTNLHQDDSGYFRYCNDFKAK